MKFLFDIDGIAYEIELSKGETKQLEFKPGRFAKVSIHKIGTEPTEDRIGNAYLRVEFDNGNVWHSKDAVIARIISKSEKQRWRIGKEISDLRKQRGMTQQDVADRADIKRPHVTRVELGRYNFGFDTLQAIADALDADIRIVPRQ